MNVSLLLGLIAAVAWGFHDLSVRYISQRSSIPAAILTVLVVGSILILPFAVIWGDWAAMTPRAYWLAAGSGVVFAIATLGLYFAFAIGPVRLVAPIIGSYPILSVGLAAWSGATVSTGAWAAVGVIIAGVAFVAAYGHSDEKQTDRGRAILWAVMAGVGFAGTFALGQNAVRAGGDLPVILAARLFAVATIGGLALMLRRDVKPGRKELPLLAVMGALDALALGLVMVAGARPDPELASVASSTFGMVTIILAWAILREPMTLTQWISVFLVFCGIGYLAL